MSNKTNLWVTKETIYTEMIDGMEVAFHPISRTKKMAMASSFTDDEAIVQQDKVFEFLFDTIISIGGLSDQDKIDFLEIQNGEAISNLYAQLMLFGSPKKEQVENLDLPSERPQVDSTMADAQSAEKTNAGTDQEK